MEISEAFAHQMDEQDSLARFRNEFLFPQKDGVTQQYFCGHSLGLQPKRALAAIKTELDTWVEMAVGGYFGGKNPWLQYHDYCAPALARMVGAQPLEVTVMNTLTVNLHLMMETFYRPTTERHVIMMEAGAFPSDQYAVETQVRLKGFSPELSIVEIAPRAGESLLRTEDILTAIETEGPRLALVLFGGMNYYSGQVFDMQTITAAAHAVGAYAGFDLAHVVGNIPVNLHDWQVDFAVWCSYKYLNGGPGAVGGLFVHERHATNTQLPRMGGWWGNNESVRFKMEKGFEPKAAASGWCLSTSQVFNTVCLKASLEIFEEAGIENLRAKSMQLTGYLEFLLRSLQSGQFQIITPGSPNERGAQLSLFFHQDGKEVHEALLQAGMIIDYRNPGVIRVAPVPLYCSYMDVYRFYEVLAGREVRE